MVTISFKSKCENENLDERDFYEADFAKFTEDDKFLVLYKLKSENIVGGEVGRFRAEYVIGYIIEDDSEQFLFSPFSQGLSKGNPNFCAKFHLTKVQRGAHYSLQLCAPEFLSIVNFNNFLIKFLYDLSIVIIL